MNNRIYEVKFEVLMDDNDEWMTDEVRILGSEDALTVVPKAKRWAKRYWEQPYEDDEGRKIKPKLEAFRLLGIEVVAEAEVV